MQDHLTARIAGPSRVTVRVSPQDVPLTVEGILAALLGGDIVPAGDVNGPTAIEAVWRLVVSPEPRSGRGTVVLSHPVVPIAADAVGLWEMALRASEIDAAAARHDARLALRPMDRDAAAAADPANGVALTQFARTTIYDLGSRQPALATKLDLSCLGSSLSVSASWPTVEWKHHSRLGRDHHVRFTVQGRVFPLGHRAQYDLVSERVHRPWVPDVLALKQRQTLTITEPVRGEADDERLRRVFPFDTVEILDTTVDVAHVETISLPRPSPAASELLEQLASAEDGLEPALLAALAAVYGPGTQPGDFAPAAAEDAVRRNEHAVAEVLAYWELRDRIQSLTERIAAIGRHPVEVGIWPLSADGTPIRFRVRLRGALGDVEVTMPLLFVIEQQLNDPGGSLPAFDTRADPGVLDALAGKYGTSGEVPIGAVRIDLVRAGAERRTDSDVQEVHALNITGVPDGRGFRPRLGPHAARPDDPARWGFAVGFPEVRTLLGEVTSPTRLLYSDDYEAVGPGADVVFVTPSGETVPLDFVGRSDRSGGLLAPCLAADGVSRRFGLVQRSALATPVVDLRQSFDPATTLLGFPLIELIETAADQPLAPSDRFAPPTIVSRLTGGAPEVTMVWPNVALKSAPPFVARGSRMRLAVTTGAGATTTSCEVRDFTLEMPPGDDKMLSIDFDRVEFIQQPGRAPTLDVEGVRVTFLGKLRLLEDLQRKVTFAGAGPRVEIEPGRLVAHYGLAVPDATCGAFVLRNIAFTAAVEVPFTGEPVCVRLGFASRSNPFNLSVLMFGGGGYVELAIDQGGLRRLEAALEFGASVAVDFLVASGEVHALGGVRYVLDDAGVRLTGYLRFGGSIEVLGLVSVSIEMRVELTYDLDNRRLVGRAKLVIDIDLLIYSDSVELDSGDWVLMGGSPPPQVGAFSMSPEPAGESPRDVWRRYVLAFRSEAA